jgi:hypothetical protein
MAKGVEFDVRRGMVPDDFESMTEDLRDDAGVDAEDFLEPNLLKGFKVMFPFDDVREVE